jgi:hypothetical protein
MKPKNKPLKQRSAPLKEQERKKPPRQDIHLPNDHDPEAQYEKKDES